MGPRQLVGESSFSARLPWSILHLSDKDPSPGGVGEGLNGGAASLHQTSNSRKEVQKPTCLALVGRLQQEADLEPGLQLPFVQPGSSSNGMSQWFPH